MERRYGALGLIAGFYQLVGILMIIGFIGLGGISLLNSSRAYNPYTSLGVASSVITIVAGALSGLGLVGVGELINLFRDMEFNSRVTAHFTELNEKNTRRTAEAMEYLARRRTQTSG